ncbi:hypothetical protein Tco_0446121 [Tanacetum coccineum]
MYNSSLSVIMEYLVNISKRRAFWSLNEDILKITILKTNTLYPSRKIRRIRACTHQRPQRNKVQYAVSRRSQYARRKRAEELEQRYQFHRRHASLIKRVYMLSLRERIELDLEARLIGETLVLNKSLDHFLEDYIELNDLNEPFALRRIQGDDLMPTIEEGGVIEEFRTRDKDLDTGIDDYPSYCDDDNKIHIDCAHNLKFSFMIGFEFTHVNFFPLVYVNVMSKKFHNSIMKDKMVYKGDNVVGALMNVSIFVGTFSIVTNFVVLEDMDAYRDEGMGDVIVGEPFLREVGIKVRQFDGMINIYNGNDDVTYQMVQSHPRSKLIDFTTVIFLLCESEDEGTIEEIIWNYYDLEDGSKDFTDDIEV